MKYGWHILHADGLLRYNDGRAPKNMEWIRANSSYIPFRSITTKQEWEVKRKAIGKDIKLCKCGMHASATIHDAISNKELMPFGVMPHHDSNVDALLCRVLIRGYIKYDITKFVGLERMILWRIRITSLHRSYLYRMSNKEAAETVCKAYQTGEWPEGWEPLSSELKREVIGKR